MPCANATAVLPPVDPLNICRHLTRCRLSRSMCQSLCTPAWSQGLPAEVLLNMFEPSAFGMVVPDPQAFPERLPFWCLPLLSEQSRQACKKSSPILKACPDVHMSLKLVVIACRIQWRPSSGRPPGFQHACRHCHLGLPRGNARCLSTAWMSDRPCWPSSGEALSVGPAMQRSPNMVFIAGVCHRGSGLVSLDPSAAALAVMLVSWCSCSNHLLEHQWCGTCPLMAQHPQMRCRCQKRCSPQPVEGAQRAQSAACGRPAPARPAAAALR